MSQLLENCYRGPSESPTKGLAQLHWCNSAINTPPQKKDEVADRLHLSYYPGAPRPNSYSICCKYRLVLAVCSGWERCAGHLLLFGSGAVPVFLSLAHHIVPVCWIYRSAVGTKQTIWIGEMGWNGVGLGESKPFAPRRATCDPVGQKLKALLEAKAAGVRLRLARRAGCEGPSLCS